MWLFSLEEKNFRVFRTAQKNQHVLFAMKLKAIPIDGEVS